MQEKNANIFVIMQLFGLNYIYKRIIIYLQKIESVGTYFLLKIEMYFKTKLIQ